MTLSIFSYVCWSCLLSLLWNACSCFLLMFLFRLFGFFLLVYRSYLYVLNNNPSLHFATFSNLLSVCGSLFLFQYFGLIELLNFYCTWVYRFFFLYDFFSFLLLHLFKKASLILEHSRSSIYVCWITAAAGTERAGCLVQALQVLSWQCWTPTMFQD